eukprot:jgi/Ulvmu1/8793/UM048_0048.1
MVLCVHVSMDATEYASTSLTASHDALRCLATSGSGTPKAGSIQLRVFPPAHLFTVTMGRSRSLARFCIEGSDVVAALLRTVVDPSGYRSPEVSTGELPDDTVFSGEPSAITPPPMVRVPPPASATMPAPAVATLAVDPARRSSEQLIKSRQHAMTTASAREQGTSADGAAQARMQVAQALVDACDSYDSATSLLGEATLPAVAAKAPPAAPPPGESLASLRATAASLASTEGRKSLSLAAAQPRSATAAQLPGAAAAPQVWPRPLLLPAAPSAVGAVAPPLPPPRGVTPPPRATGSPSPTDGAAAPAAAPSVAGSEFATTSPVMPFAAPGSPMPTTLPRRSLSSSGIATVNPAESIDPSSRRPMGGMRPWDSRAQSLQLSAQMSGVSLATPGDDCSTLFDAMGRPVPLAHAFSAAAAEAKSSVGRRHSIRSQFARGGSEVSNSYESTYAPDNLPGLNSTLPPPHVLPGIRSEGDLAALVAPRCNRMASLDLTTHRRSTRPVAGQRSHRNQIGSLGTSAPGVYACAALAEDASEADGSGEEASELVQQLHAHFRSDPATAAAGGGPRGSGVSSGADTRSSLSSCARHGDGNGAGNGVGGSRGGGPGARGGWGRAGASLDGSARTRSSGGGLSTGAAGGRAISSDSTPDSGLDFVLANPGRVPLPAQPKPIREVDVPLLSHAIPDLQVEGSLPKNL